MKANLSYISDGSYGTTSQWARGVNGVWFNREYGYNGYSRGWSKWRMSEEKPPITFENEKWCDYNKCYIPIKRKRFMGFNPAEKTDHSRLRLPN